MLKSQHQPAEINLIPLYLSELQMVPFAGPNSFYLFMYLFIYLFIYFIYLVLAALGLRCCMRAFCSCGEQWLLFVAVCGLLIVVASLVAVHGL